MRQIIITLFIGLFVAAFQVSADDIIPKEDLGEIQILFPDLSAATGYTGADDPDRYFKIYFAIKNKKILVKAGDVYKVDAGPDGCIWVESAWYRAAEVCNVEIKPKELTVVNLAALSLKWDMNKVSVNVGPRLFFQLEGVGLLPRNSRRIGINSMDAREMKKLYVLPSGDREVRFANVISLDGVTRRVQLSPGAYLDYDLKVEDRRAQVKVSYEGLPKAFSSIPTDHVNILHRSSLNGMSYPKIFFPFHNWASSAFQLRRHTNNYRQKNNIKSSIRLVSGEFVNLHMYHLDDKPAGDHYELVVNNIPTILSLAPAETANVNVVNVNIHNYVSTLNGKYLFYQMIMNDEGVLERNLVKIPYRKDMSAYEQKLPTETSLFLPVGWKYEFDFYSIDALGKESLEDTQSLDLTNR